MTLWRPRDEGEATGTMAVFVEWLRATGARPDADPAWVRAWLGSGDVAAAHAAARFCGLDPAGPCDAWLRRYRGARAAVARIAADATRRSWTFDEIAGSDAAWHAACGVRFAAAELLRAIATRLLIDETRPDDTVCWKGDAGEPSAWAPLAIGACVVISARA